MNLFIKFSPLNAWFFSISLSFFIVSTSGAADAKCSSWLKTGIENTLQEKKIKITDLEDLLIFMPRDFWSCSSPSEAVPVLKTVLLDEKISWQARRAAAIAFEMLASSGSLIQTDKTSAEDEALIMDAVRALTEALSERSRGSWSVCHAAMKALGEMGSHAEASLPNLLALGWSEINRKHYEDNLITKNITCLRDGEKKSKYFPKYAFDAFFKIAKKVKNSYESKNKEFLSINIIELVEIELLSELNEQIKEEKKAFFDKKYNEYKEKNLIRSNSMQVGDVSRKSIEDKVQIMLKGEIDQQKNASKFLADNSIKLRDEDVKSLISMIAADEKISVNVINALGKFPTFNKEIQEILIASLDYPDYSGLKKNATLRAIGLRTESPEEAILTLSKYLSDIFNPYDLFQDSKWRDIAYKNQWISEKNEAISALGLRGNQLPHEAIPAIVKYSCYIKLFQDFRGIEESADRALFKSVKGRQNVRALISMIAMKYRYPRCSKYIELLSEILYYHNSENFDFLNKWLSANAISNELKVDQNKIEMYSDMQKLSNEWEEIKNYDELIVPFINASVFISSNFTWTDRERDLWKKIEEQMQSAGLKNQAKVIKNIAHRKNLSEWIVYIRENTIYIIGALAALITLATFLIFCLKIIFRMRF